MPKVWASRSTTTRYVYGNVVRALLILIPPLFFSFYSKSVLGGFRAQGRTAVKAKQVVEDALAVQEAGAFAVVVECVPSPVAQAVTEALEIPTIGIGAGAFTSGQVGTLECRCCRTAGKHTATVEGWKGMGRDETERQFGLRIGENLPALVSILPGGEGLRAADLRMVDSSSGMWQFGPTDLNCLFTYLHYCTGGEARADRSCLSETHPCVSDPHDPLVYPLISCVKLMHRAGARLSRHAWNASAPALPSVCPAVLQELRQHRRRGEIENEAPFGGQGTGHIDRLGR